METETKDLFYDRQSKLISKQSQNNIKSAKILIININGLTSEISKNLVLKGFNIDIIDDNIITESDINNNFIYTERDISLKKSKIAKLFFEDINKFAEINCFNIKELDNEVFIKMYDIIIMSLNDVFEYFKYDKIFYDCNVTYYFCNCFDYFAFSYIKIKRYYKQVIKYNCMNIQAIVNTLSFKDSLNFIDNSYPLFLLYIKDRFLNNENTDNEKYYKLLDAFINAYNNVISPIYSIMGSVISQNILNLFIQITKPEVNYLYYDIYLGDCINMIVNNDQYNFKVIDSEDNNSNN